MNKYIINFLQKCKIKFDNIEQLDGLIISRETVLSDNIYDNVKDDIVELRKKYSSSSLTALQKTAEIGQKWPLLNLVRQILKIHDYIMKPVRKSNGYTKEGKKIYKRFFIIHKIKKV